MVEFTQKMSIIQKVLDYAQAEGKNTKGNKKPLITDCILNVSENELEILASEADDAVFMHITVPLKEAEEGEIPIELKDAIVSISRFKDEDVEIKFDEKHLQYRRVMKNTKRLQIKRPTPSIEDIKSKLDKFPFKFDEKKNCWATKIDGKEILYETYIKINADEFKEVIEDGEQVQHRSFPISVTENAINVIVEDTDTGAQNDRELNAIKIQTKEPIASLFSRGFGNVFGQLSGEIEIWMANNEAMIIRKKDETITVIYVIAMVELTEEENEPEATEKQPEEPEEPEEPEMETIEGETEENGLRGIMFEL